MFWKTKIELRKLSSNSSGYDISDSIRTCATYSLLQNENLSHTHTRALRVPCKPLTSAKWHLHQGGHDRSQKTIMPPVSMHKFQKSHLSSLPVEIHFLSCFFYFLKLIFIDSWLEKGLAGVLVMTLHPLTQFISQSKGANTTVRQDSFPVPSLLQLKWACQIFFSPTPKVPQYLHPNRGRKSESSFRVVG